MFCILIDMFLTVHGTAGIALGMFTGNPLLAFMLGLVSHSILDIIPHGDEWVDTWSRAGNRIERLSIIFVSEFSLSLIIIFSLFHELILSNPFVLLAGMAGGMAPDFGSGVATVFRNKFKICRWYYNLDKYNHTLLQNPIPLAWGMGLQVSTLILLTYQILN